MTRTTHESDVRRMRARRGWRVVNYCLGLIGLLFASVIVAPQLLAFPHQTRIGTTMIYAEQPIDRPRMAVILAAADAKLRRSPLYQEPVGTRIFMTDGGWRWRVLALHNARAQGLTRPWSDLVSDAVVLNRSDAARNTIGRSRRSLSGVIAHERTHIMVRRHLGLIDGIRLSRWISEGYADHVAAESPLSAAEAAALRARGVDHPAIFYYQSRRRVEAALAANGGDVDMLLTGN